MSKVYCQGCKHYRRDFIFRFEHNFATCAARIVTKHKHYNEDMRRATCCIVNSSNDCPEFESKKEIDNG